MKRVLFSLYLFLFISVFSFCQAVVLFTPEKPEITASFELAGALKQDMRSAPVRFDQNISVDLKELRFDSGIAFQDSRFDFTNKIDYIPLFINRFRLGFGITYHFYRYYNVFSENDFLFATRFRWCSTDFFTMDLALGMQMKIASIDSITAYKGFITNICFFLDYTARWNFTEKFTGYAALSTVDFYDYPLFGTIFFKGGISYKIRKNFGLDASLSFKFIDMYISAVSLNQCILQAGVKVYF